MRRKQQWRTRREAVISLLALAVPASVLAQPRAVSTLGILAPDRDPSLDVFFKTLSSLGWIDGQSVRVVQRFANETSESLDKLAAEFVSSGANVILVTGRDATLAASRVTSTIPIVMGPVGNAHDFVPSFSRPAGNITGLTIQQHDTDAKLITLLKETVPSLSKVMVLHRKSGGTHHEVFEAARDSGLEVIRASIGDAENVERAFTAAKAEKVDGLFVVHNRATFAPLIRKIGAAALSHGLPAAASERDYAEAGFLLTYTADEADLKRRAAFYVDPILRGTKPGDLPVEQPTKFQLVVNLKTTKVLDLPVPDTVLARADEVIE